MTEELCELVRRARDEEDRDAFGEVASRTYGVVLSATRKVLGNGDSAEDAAQETFVTAIRKLHRLTDERCFPGWIKVVAKRVALNYASRRRTAAESPGDCGYGWVGSEDRGPEDVAIAGEDSDRVRVAITRIPAKYATILREHYFGGVSIREIADEHSIPVGTAKRRLHDARQILREEMQRSDRFPVRVTTKSRRPIEYRVRPIGRPSPTDGRMSRRGVGDPKDKHARYRHRNLSAGKCPRCGKPPETELRLCNECRVKRRESYRRRRRRKMAGA